MDYFEVLVKLKHYCAYQERCYADLEKKMREYELSEDEKYELIRTLRDENYFNEERYVKAFCSGKFKVKKWGRNKIRMELKQKGIPNSLIDIGLPEIDEDDYMVTLKTLLMKKASLIGNFENKKNQLKLSHYAIQKGYENGIVWETISTMNDEL